MTTEQKLQHFYDISVEEAHKESEKMLDDYKKELEKQFDLHKKEKSLEADSLMKAESQRAAREINKALSSSQLEIKRHWSKKQDELKESLFIEVLDKIHDFMKSPAYKEYLIRKIQEAVEFAEEDELSIFIAPCDQSKLDDLSKKTGAALLVSQEDFIGGMKATIPHKNILIDNSFKSALENAKHNFTFDGGLTYE